MNPEVHDILNYQRIAGEAFFRPAGGDWQNLGDVILHKKVPEVKRVAAKVHKRFAVSTIIREDVADASLIWTVQLQEYVSETLPLILFGSQIADAVQAGGLGLSVTLQAVRQRRVYELGQLNVSNVNVSVAGAPMASGVDYKVDAAAGTIYVIDGGGIASGVDLLISFDAAALSMDAFTPLSAPTKSGMFKLIESDNLSSNLRTIFWIPCDLSPDNFGEETPEVFSHFDLRVVATGPCVVKQRQLSGNLQLLAEEGEALDTEDGTVIDPE